MRPHPRRGHGPGSILPSVSKKLIFGGRASVRLALCAAIAACGCGTSDPPFAPLGPLKDSGTPEEDSAVIVYPREPFDVTGIVNAAFAPLEGAEVDIYDQGLTLLDSGTTDAAGRFTLSGNLDQVNFIRVYPKGDNMGAVWPLQPTGTDEPYQLGSVINLPPRQTFEDELEDLTGAGDIRIDYDDTSASVAVSYNSGGPHAYVGGYGPVVKANDVPAEVAYILDGDPITVIQLKGAIIPPTCPTKLEGLCRTDPGGGRAVYFPNVSSSAVVKITTTSVPNMTCHMRHHDGKQWPMYPDTQTVAIVDCGG